MSNIFCMFALNKVNNKQLSMNLVITIADKRTGGDMPSGKLCSDLIGG